MKIDRFIRLLSAISATALLLLLGVLGWGERVDAQKGVQKNIKIGVLLPQAAAEKETNVGIHEEFFPGGAPLNTSKELQRAMNKARTEAKNGHFEIAVSYWKRLLERIDLSLMSRSGVTTKTSRHRYRKYLLARTEIEQQLVEFPPEVLQLYRDEVDTEAGQLLEERLKGDPVSSLQQLVNHYFLSSQGDEAAFKLASLYADRGQFAKSAYLLERILNDYPNSTVSRESVMLLLSLTHAHSGNLKEAHTIISQLRTSGKLSENLSRAEMVIRQLQEENKQHGNALVANQWAMRLGNATRRGLMPAPEGFSSETLTSLWEYPFGTLTRQILGVVPFASSEATIQLQNVNNNNFQLRGKRLMLTSSVRRPTATQQLSMEMYRSDASHWRALETTPVQQMLFSHGCFFLKTDDRLACCDSKTGKLKWLGRPNKLLSSQPKISATRTVVETMPPLRRLSGAADAFLYGDRLLHSMSIADDLVFNIEGQFAGLGTVAPSTSGNRQAQNIRNSRFTGPQRGRKNWLAAYQIQNGKLKWYRSAVENPLDEDDKTGFLAAPVPYGDSIILPVSRQGGVWLTALEKETGKTIWRIMLCDPPMGSCSNWSPVGMAVEGGDVYIATGAGLVFAVDARSGTLRWSIRYQRTGQSQNVLPGRNQTTYVQGWDEDIVIPYGHLLIVIPSDYETLFAIDRSQGKIAWESPQIPVSDDAATRYCLGVVNGKLFVAGSRVLRCYNLSGGRLEWERPISVSLGRGMLTQSAIYLPVKNKIVKFATSTGEQLSEVDVFTGADEPVGNLYLNQNQFFVVSPNRVYNLTPMKSHLESLAKRIKAGDSTASWQRMKLRMRMKQIDGAIDDLKTTFKLNAANTENGTATTLQTLCNGIVLLNLEKTHPLLTFDLFLKADEKLQYRQTDIPEPLLTSYRQLLGRTIQQSAQIDANENSSQFVTRLIELAPLCETPSLLAIAKTAVRQHASRVNVPLLSKHLQSSAANKRLLAAISLQHLQKEEAVPQIKQLLSDSDHRIQLQAATFLISHQKREALSTLIGLLKSEDINIRAHSISMLRRLSGLHHKYEAYGANPNRAESIKKWQVWYREQGQTAKLDFTASLIPERGRTLILSQNNRLYEYDLAGKQTWYKEINYLSACKGLPNGHRLVAIYRPNSIVEYNESGKEIWSIIDLPNQNNKIIFIERLKNGNTLLASNKEIYEYQPNTKLIRLQKSPSTVRQMQYLKNGNLLTAEYSNRKIIERGPKMENKWELNTTGKVYSAQRLPNGNTLVCMAGSSNRATEVVVFNPANKIVSRLKTKLNPTYAQRLSNGHTLLMNSKGVHELNPAGETVWEKTLYSPFYVHRY